MKKHIKNFILGGRNQNTLHQNIGILILRFFVGLALCTVFEKFLPKNGIWGPQEWFIQDTANMGFPIPTFFAWFAVLTEFFGGLLLMLGLFTRPAALLNVLVTFTATFIYHDADIGGAGLLSFFFFIMCTCILLFGPGKFSMDYLINLKTGKRLTRITTVVLLLFTFNSPAEGFNPKGQLDHSVDLIEDSLHVEFYLRNNSILPKKKTFIIYQPQQEGNNTIIRWFLPFQKVRFDLPLDSKIYIATNSQVNRVMQGKRIDSDQPYVLVNEAIKNDTLPLKGRN